MATLTMTSDDDGKLLAGLRDGDDDAFVTLVERYHSSLLRLARLHVQASAAEDVVQDTWIGILRGLDTFEGRASFKTWLVQQEAESSEHAVDPSRFQSSEGRYPGHWLLKPSADEPPAEQLLAGEFNELVRTALDTLPPAQSEVVRLRDVEGFTSEEVCQLLDVTEGNQRVLLHRGRSKMRATLEDYMAARVELTEQAR